MYKKETEKRDEKKVRKQVVKRDTLVRKKDTKRNLKRPIRDFWRLNKGSRRYRKQNKW